MSSTIRHPLLRALDDRFFWLCRERPRLARPLAGAWGCVCARVDAVGAYGIWGDRRELASFNADYFCSYEAGRDGHGPERFDAADRYAEQVPVLDRVVAPLELAVETRWASLRAWSSRARLHLDSVERARDQETRPVAASAPLDDDLPF